MTEQAKIPGLLVTEWSGVPREPVPGERGSATSRTVEVGGARLRMLEYSSGYRSDHWCERGHVLLVIEGALDVELEEGETLHLREGMSVRLPDGRPAHRTASPTGGRFFVVD